MRSRIGVLVAVVLAVTSGAARADLGYYQDGGLGTSQVGGGLAAFEDRGFSARVAIGYRRAHLGGELMATKAELPRRDDEDRLEGIYTALTVGPMITGRVVLGRTMMDAPFARWLELYGRLGPTHTWMYGDPGDGPPDGTRGFGFAAGGGIRWVFAAFGLSFDVTYVDANLYKDRVHDPRDELGVRDEPPVLVRGHIVTTTLGFGFVL